MSSLTVVTGATGNVGKALMAALVAAAQGWMPAGS